jgi:anaphase-promoting complex subunit 5
MLHRLPPENSSQKWALNEIQPDMHPLEVFYDVNKLLEVRRIFKSRCTTEAACQQDQPISVAFNKIMQAVGVQDHWAEVQLVPPPEEELWVQHAVQSIVWRAAGADFRCSTSLHGAHIKSRVRQTCNHRRELDNGIYPPGDYR